MSHTSKSRVTQAIELMKNGELSGEELAAHVEAPSPTAEEFFEQSPTPKTKKGVKPTGVVIPRKMKVVQIQIPIIGTSGLLCHAWSKKAIDQMARKQSQIDSGNAKSKAAKREPKIPEDEFRGSLYGPLEFGRHKGKYWFPATAFKRACATASLSMGADISKSFVLQSFHIRGEAEGGMGCVLEGTPEMVQHMVKIPYPANVADIRYRGMFYAWSTMLDITFNEAMVSESTIVEILNVAGFGVGIGEWRPEKGGIYGQFKVSG